jgi:hypothetical protein
MLATTLLQKDKEKGLLIPQQLKESKKHNCCNQFAQIQQIGKNSII